MIRKKKLKASDALTGFDKDDDANEGLSDEDEEGDEEALEDEEEEEEDNDYEDNYFDNGEDDGGDDGGGGDDGKCWVTVKGACDAKRQAGLTLAGAGTLQTEELSTRAHGGLGIGAVLECTTLIPTSCLHVELRG